MTARAAAAAPLARDWTPMDHLRRAAPIMASTNYVDGGENAYGAPRPSAICAPRRSAACPGLARPILLIQTPRRSLGERCRAAGDVAAVRARRRCRRASYYAQASAPTT